MNPWKGLAKLPSRVWILCGCTLVNRMGTMALPFLALFLIQGCRWTPQAASTAMLVYGAGSIGSAPLWGKLADRMGHTRMLALSLWGSGAFLLVIPFAPTRILLLLAIFLWAVLTQAFSPSSMALLTDLAPPEQRRAVFALHRLVTNLGLALGPALGGIIASYGFRWVFWTDGATTLASATLLMLCFAPGEVQLAPREDQDLSHGRSAWRDRGFLYLLLGFFPVLLVFSQTGGVLPLWVVNSLGFTPRFFGLLFTLNTIMIVLLEVALNLATAHWPHQRLFVLGSLLFAVGFGVTGLVRSHTGLLATVVIWTFGEMIMLPASSDAVALIAPPHRRGEYLGLFSFTIALAMAMGPWLGIMAYAHASSASVWAGCGVAGAISALMLSRCRLSPWAMASGSEPGSPTRREVTAPGTRE